MKVYRYLVKIKGTKFKKIISFGTKQKKDDVTRKFNKLYSLTGHNNEYTVKLINCKNCSKYNNLIGSCSIDNKRTIGDNSCKDWEKR